MAVTTRSILRHIVQTSDDFALWTTQSEIRCNECSEGAGQIVGHATLLRYFGVTREPGATGSPTSKTPLTGLVGQWVRVLIEDATGAIDIGGVDYAPLWYGIIDAESINDEGGGNGAQQWTCAGLVAHLSRVALVNGWTEAMGSSGSTVADYILRVPTFNAPEGGGRSGEDPPPYTIDGKTCFVFDYFEGLKWTSKQILDMLLASHGRWDKPGGSFMGDVHWELDAGTLLDWEAPTLDVNGMSLLDAVNALINPRRGLTWRLSVDAATATATIVVKSISASAITVGSTTLAAATDTATPDLTSLWHQGVQLMEDQTSTYDHICVVGARPWVTITLAYDPANATAEAKSLIAGWPAGSETAWNTAPGPTTDGVWRTFVTNPEWDGRNYGGSSYGLRQNLTLDGNGDFTGARAYDSAVDFPPSVMKIESRLPVGEGWTTSKTGARQDGMVFWKPNGASTWYDLQADGQPWSRSLSVDSYPPAVHIGSVDRTADKSQSEQQVNKYILATGGVALATVGMREPDPLIVSWTRASASWPRGSPRTLTVQMPSAEQWVSTQGTVKGVASGSLTTESSAQTVRDDVPTMQSWLAFLRAYYAEPARALSWTERGVIDHAYGSGACAPAALVTSATMSWGSRTINAVVSRRAWRLDENGFGTSYFTERIVPDIEAIR